MSEPKESPEGLALRARPRRVVRLSRRALAVIAGGVALVVLLGTIWALRPAARRGATPAEELHNVERVQRAEGLDRLPRDYGSLPKVPALGAPLPGEFGRPVVRSEAEAGVPALPPRPNFKPDPEEDALRTERVQIKREGEAVSKAEVFFRLRQATAAGTPAAVATVASAGAPAGPPAKLLPSMTDTVDETTTQNLQEHKQRFTEGSADARIYGGGRLQKPISPDQLMAGTVIPAALVTGINSALPGQVIAAVTEDVRDSVTGGHVLVPQGSKLLGQYDSQVAYGQRRLLLVWLRLIMPDGSSISLDKLPGSDTAGLSGLEDGVDRHWDRILAGAALSTLIGIGAELAAPDNRQDGNRIVIATRQSSQDTVNQVGQQLTRRNLNVQPTLTIRPGFPVRVIVNRDLVLAPNPVTVIGSTP